MPLRTIMIFPDFKNMDLIHKIREKYDPLAALVKPHITLIFPFESEIRNDELAQIMDVRLEGRKPFELILNGFSKQVDRFGNYLFLNVTKGAEVLREFHQLFYQNEFREYDSGYEYVPHMTVGKLSSVPLLNEAYTEISVKNHFFCTIVDRVSVELIGEKEESIIIIEKSLNT